MKREITFDEYIKNPLGGRVLGDTSAKQMEYKSKIDKILMRENGKVNYFLFKDNDARYFILVKVPSEKVKGFTYDVVIEFNATDKKILSESTLSNYKVKFYSNDPAFVYTYAYSFIQNGLFIDDLSSKMNKTARTQAAVVTNVNNNVGYVKSIVFAYFIMKERNLFDKSLYTSIGRKYSKVVLNDMVLSSNQTFKNRQQAEKEQREAAREFKKLDSVDNRNSKIKAKSSKIASVVNKIKSVATAKKAKTAKRI